MAGKSSKELLDAANEARHAQLRAAAAKTTDDAALARAQAEATARSMDPLPAPGGPASLAARMPAAAKLATGTATVPKVTIWEEDYSKHFTGRKVDHLTGPWLGAVRKLAKAREQGDVLEPTIYGVAARLAHYTRQGKGAARVTYATLAFEVGCTTETIRKVIRWLERHALVVTKHIMERVNKLLWRGANSYLVKMPDEGEPAPPAPEADGADDAPAAALTPLTRLTAHLAWTVQFFRGLVVRPSGLNTTGLRLARAGPA